MKKLALILGILFCAATAGAQCTGSGITWSCAAGTTAAQVNTMISSASNGATATFATGSYSWTAEITFSTTNGITLICATAPNCVINSSLGTLFGTGGFPNNNNLYRISGFTINDSGASFLSYFCSGGGCTGTMGEFRADHNVINDPVGSAAFFFGDSVAHDIQAYGVIDHNTLTCPDHCKMVYVDSTLNVTPTVSKLGTANNLFVETNTIINTTNTNSGDGCTDGWGPIFSIVVRYNTATNCRWLAHGIGDGGGPDNFEVYNNTTTWNSGGVPSGVADCFRSFHDQGAGTLIAFGNTCTPAPGQSDNTDSMAFQDFRDCGNGPSCNEGSAPVACDGTVVNAIFDNTSTVTFSDGNRTPSTTWYGYPCWHQPSRDEAGNYKPIYSWNNLFGDGTASVLEFDGNPGTPPPGCTPGAAGNCAYDTIHMLANREYFVQVSKNAQTSTTSPFNGTTGMGFGTFANRPTTCTTSTEAGAGVGYFATDIGSQGTLYTCSATNTWTVYYTPYTYPHPLVSGSGSVSLSPSSQNFGSVNTGSSSSPVTFTMSNSSGTTATSVSPSTTGGNSGDFTISNTGAGSCSAASGTLTNGSSCTFTVMFTPSAAGSRATTLSVSYSGGDSLSPQLASLSGTGTSSGSAIPSSVSGGVKLSVGAKVQ